MPGGAGARRTGQWHQEHGGGFGSGPMRTTVASAAAATVWSVTGAGTVAEVLRAVDLLGVAANALLGGAVARRHNLDPVGFAVLAILSGLGGGLLRDVLLQKGPPVALTDYSYLVTALVAAGVAFAVRFEGRTWDRVFPVVDALALGAWSAVGAQKTLLSGLSWLPAILLGTVTAVGGGAIRDIAVSRVPAIFGGNTLYATWALAGSAVMVGVQGLGRPVVGLVAATVVAAVGVLVSRWRGWMLPHGVLFDRSGRPLRRRVRR